MALAQPVEAEDAEVSTSVERGESDEGPDGFVRGNDSGADCYKPTDPDEQRRAWVLQTIGSDHSIEDVMRAAEWIKRGPIPAPILQIKSEV